MIRIYPKDLLAIENEGVFYYSLLLEKIKFFGGQLSYVFHFTSNEVVEPSVLLKDNTEGFHSIVDYIWAKRENRLQRIAKKVDTQGFEGPGFFKNTHHHYDGKAPMWWIYDSEGNDLNKVEELSKEQKQFPLLVRIDDTIMFEQVKEKWSILSDPRL